MSKFSNLARHAFAALGAMAISTMLLANALATKSSEIHSIAGILA